MHDTLPKPRKRRKPFNHDATMYYGRTVLIGSVERVLSKRAVDRLIRIEADNQRRADKFDDGIVVPVDFIAVCIEQCWRCSICGKPMDPEAEVEGLKISVEHNPALSVCHEHSRRTVEAAHVDCNCEKNNASDTTRAAKIKRVRSVEEKHAAVMRMKGVETPAAIRRAKIAEKAAKGNRSIQSRGFPKLPESRSPSTWQRKPDNYVSKLSKKHRDQVKARMERT